MWGTLRRPGLVLVEVPRVERLWNGVGAHDGKSRIFRQLATLGCSGLVASALCRLTKISGGVCDIEALASAN